MKRRFAPVVILVAVALAGLISGGAFAYFTSSGTGTGSVTTGSNQAVTVEAVVSASPSSTLIPGGTADLVVQLDNANSFAVTIVSMAQNGSVTPVGGSGCTGANDGVTVPTQTGISISVAPGDQVLHMSGAASMSASSASGCQGASFDIPVTLTVHQP